MSNDLDMLIADLDVFTTKTKMNAFLSVEIDELIATALEEMGMRQIYDTGQSRSIFVDLARDYLGIDISYILQDEITNIWGNIRRGRGAFNGNKPNVSISNANGRLMEITIEDYGVYGQEVNDLEGKNYPSDKRPPNDYKAGHITTTIEAIDDGNLAKFEYIVNKIENKIHNKCMGRL